MDLGAWFDQFLSLFSSYNLQILLLVGSGILAISLLVLALTRWGHSRPVWKCVVLSFAAHLLLMGYAYGTRLIVQTPQVVKEDNLMQINLVEDAGSTLDGIAKREAAENSWDQFVNEQALPEVDALERPAIDSEVVIEKVVDRSVVKPNTVGPVLAALPKQQDNGADTQFNNSPVETSNEFPMIRPDLPPQKIEVARRGNGETESPLPNIELPDEIARQDIVNQFKPTERPQAGEQLPIPSEVRTPFVSNLEDPKAILPKATVSVPAAVATPDFAGARPLNGARTSKQLRVVSRPRRIADGQPLPKIYSLRAAQNRLKVARQRGGSVKTEQAVEAALHWLAENQRENGSWDSSQHGGGKETQVFGHDRGGAGTEADTGVTGLATLAFLAAGNSHLEGAYQGEVQSSLEYLVRSQKSDGDLSGNARLFAKMYCHSMSLLALSEALAMTGDKRLLPAVQSGINFTVQAQNRRDGGWRYQPGDPGDMSQFGWQVLALHSAELGGATVPAETQNRMRSFLESCSSGIGGGLASYKPNQGPSVTMTAEALMCRYFLTKDVSPMTVMEATRHVSRERPTPTHVNLYYWYYGTLAMYHAGGPEWKAWNQELKQTLLSLQRTQGSDAGSWPASGVWGGYGGEVYSTSMAALNLEVYYRYLPIYQQLAKTRQTADSNNGLNGFRETSHR